MAGAALPADGGLSDVMNLLTLVKSPGDTTSTTKNTVDPAGQKALLDSILTGNTALPGLATISQGQKTAGMYNSSTNTQLTNDLLARATAEIAAKNNTQSTTQHKAPAFNGKQLLTMFAASGAKKLLGPSFKGLADKTGISNIGDKLANSLGLGTSSDLGMSAVSPISEALSPAALDASSAVADTLGGNLLDGVGLTSLDSFGATALDEGATNLFADTGLGTALSAGAESGAADVAGFTALDSAAAGEGGLAADGISSIGAATPWTALAVAGAADLGQDISGGDSSQLWGDAIGGLGTGDIIKGFETGNAFDSVNPLGEGLLSSIGINTKDGSWVICTHLNNVGILSDDLYSASARRIQYLSRETLAGYHLWAIPVTRRLRIGSPALTKFFGYLAKSRCEYLLGHKRVWGWLSVILGEPICTLIGTVAMKRNKNIPDWKELYERN